jgi:hypothetical protein
MKNNYVVVAILIVISAGAGFFGGMKYQQSQRGNFFPQVGNGQMMVRNGNIGAGSIRGGFRPVAGEIISVDDKSITVKLQDESSKIILLNSKTLINKAETVDKNELKEGETVSVFGSENSDGSVTAQNVQLNPIERGQPQPPAGQ